MASVAARQSIALLSSISLALSFIHRPNINKVGIFRYPCELFSFSLTSYNKTMSSDTTGHKECDKRGNTNKESKKHNCNTSIGSEHQNNKMKGSHDGDGQITASDHQATASNPDALP